ncbi:uncharacterized protein LOC130589836 [Beta vulgaris subsp. vulgaris]|uniref:uncharacterized protein LOC130589836 n=1 Tax=Beta vulgaris subsp. vulgaris TaxID=3555 RepID=UPI0025470AD1|nr:uncharacterized protein LOC130589836 [Beta vulgaris subsp. vulgaris]
MMENQMTQAQQISHLSKPSGQLLGQTEPNPKGYIHAISLRSGRELQDPYREMNDQRKSAKESKKPSEEDQGEKVLEEEAKETEKKEPIVIPIAPYKPPVPFPQRLAQCYLAEQASKEARRSSSYSIPVKLGDIEIKNALCDLGASVSLMPLSICKKLNMGELKPTRISLQLADRTVKFPLASLKMFLLESENFSFHVILLLWKWKKMQTFPLFLGDPFWPLLKP